MSANPRCEPRCRSAGSGPRAASRRPVAEAGRRSLAEVGGVEITGIDLATGLSDERRDWLLASFRTHPILVFRDQHLTKQQQYDFTLNFGESSPSTSIA